MALLRVTPCASRAGYGWRRLGHFGGRTRCRRHSLVNLCGQRGCHWLALVVVAVIFKRAPADGAASVTAVALLSLVTRSGSCGPRCLSEMRSTGARSDCLHNGRLSRRQKSDCRQHSDCRFRGCRARLSSGTTGSATSWLAHRPWPCNRSCHWLASHRSRHCAITAVVCCLCPTPCH